MLDIEYKYYKDNQKKFLKQYKGKVIAIVGKEVVGVYENEASAYEDVITKHKIGTFLIQKCVPDEETVQTFHSRVLFFE